MAKCTDCIHYNICLINIEGDEANICPHYANKTYFQSELHFDYGIVVYKHRFSINRSLDDYEEITLTKCIRVGVELKYKTMARDKLIYEMQIVHKDENNKLQCLCLNLHDWTVNIKHIGNMKCNI